MSSETPTVVTRIDLVAEREDTPNQRIVNDTSVIRDGDQSSPSRRHVFPPIQ